MWVEALHLALTQDLGADGGFFFGAAFGAESVHAAPELDFRLPPVHLRRKLAEVEFHLGVGRPPVQGGMMNITDVPLALGSGREQDQLLAFQQEDAVGAILLDDPAQGDGQVERSFRHSLCPPNLHPF